jgi:hypothetical protein
VIGLHLNMMGLRPGIDLSQPTLSADEKSWLAKVLAERDEKTAYQRIQATRPQTLGVALTDSPVGLAAWIVEKFQAWSDCGGDPLKRFSMDLMLDNIMVYWLTGTAGTATWLYRGVTQQRIAACRRASGSKRRPASPPSRPISPSRHPGNGSSAASTCAAIRRCPRAGHFAALEEPDLLVDDVSRLLPATEVAAPPTISTSEVLADGSIRTIIRRMSDTSLAAILRLLRAQSFVEARIDPGLGAVHGLALREFMFLVQLDQAPANRLRRVDLAARLNVSQSTSPGSPCPGKARLRKARGRSARRPGGLRRADQGRPPARRRGRGPRSSASAAGIFRDRWSDKDIATLASLLGRFTAALPGDVT